MGLYQFIREQEYRNDLVGELGRWMSKNYDKRPDHNSPAFKLASEEFTACNNWTRKEALDRLNDNKRFQQIIKLEPRISEIIKIILQIRATHGYNHKIEYSRLQTKLTNLVGWYAEKKEVANSDCYDVVIQAVDDLLPPDLSNLYPEDVPEDIELDL